MNSFILSATGRMLFPWLIVLSLIVLYRGHNLPGGGFIGGLLGASAYIIYGLGESIEAARKRLRIDPVTLMAVGLTIAFVAGLPGLFMGAEFFTGEWLPGFSLPLLGKVHLGTPLVFDVGVYLTVIGFALHTTFSLAEVAHAEGGGQS
ncbi:MnhB domain-containing protein [Rubellicoccus peritrichatus]|uniref:MnhB domain-containing protein n=1 Tax=Rubellicoccus peritrichatus TaxID=3080537 RepID=A0AAQ3L6C5_9BACT|nr:MnhB domain-containing protein [Puniceicoccus sp. CR14]WOO39881.1 MnhB domain-containing protein [Puniceicoccus sp. CR14]